jgi:hypothetical protein
LPENRKRRRNTETITKLEAIEWARKNSVHSAAKKFRVDRKRIREWTKQENKLKQQVNTFGGGKRKRLQGGGRHVQHPEFDSTLASWIKEMRENKKPVTRSIIKNKAIEVFVDTDLKVRDYESKFYIRINLINLGFQWMVGIIPQTPQFCTPPTNNSLPETAGQICRSSCQVHHPY